MNDSELRDHLETARVAILATIRADGRVDLVPVTFAVEEDLMVTMVDHKPKSTMDLKRLDNIGQFPEVTFLAEHYDDEDWDQLWWVRVRGRAKVHQAGAEWERAAEMMSARYSQYQAISPAGPAIVVEITELSGWSAAERS
jgi:PPOX class probable F420-dependent enzyme